MTFRRGVKAPSKSPSRTSPVQGLKTRSGSERREPALLGPLVQEQILKFGLGKRMKEAQAVLIYKDVVGSQIAAVSEAFDVRGGKLFVKVHSPTWKEELLFTRHLIAEKINAKLGADIIKQVYLV